MSIKENKDLAERLSADVWNAKHRDVIDELIAPNCVFHAGDREFRGPRGYRTFFDTYVRAFPDLSLQVNDLIAEGDFVVTAYTARGQHTGPLMGIAPTGKLVKVRGVTIARYKNGMMVEGDTLWNEMSLMQQIEAVSKSITRKVA